MSRIEHLVRDSVKALQPYSSARDEYSTDQSQEGMVFLDANESPFNTGLNRYPDPYQSDLKQVLSDYRGVTSTNIILGNGSDELIDLLFRAFCEPGQDKAVLLPPTYGMYSVSSAINGVETIEVPLLEGLKVDFDRLGTVTGAKLLFVCTPNNPTGAALALDEISSIAEGFSGIVVVDEAYADFSQQPSAVSLLDKHDNLIVLQTFSKAWGLAGIRLGAGYTSQEVIQVLNKIKPPYNVNQLTQRVAVEAIRNHEQKDSWVRAVLAQREVLQLSLQQSAAVKKVWPTEANFILVEVDNADVFYEFFLDRGIVLRNRSKLKGCENCVRLSVGTMEENVKFLEILREFEMEVVK